MASPSLKLRLKKVWLWCKKNWQLFVGILIGLSLYVVSRRPFNISETLDRTREDHEKQIEALNKSHEIEIELQRQASKRALDRMIQVEKQHEQAQIELDDKKRKRIEQLLSNSDEDPNEITRRIAEITGFEMVLD
jgi:hypothetical protein